MIMPERLLQHIATIQDLELGVASQLTQPVVSPKGMDEWTIRFASRCLITDGDRIALQHIDEENITKIPGGGIRYDETTEAALTRELEEEVGLEIDYIRALGILIEYRREWKVVQISYCYAGEVDRKQPVNEPTEYGSSLVWADGPLDAIDKIKLSSGPEENAYDRSFAIRRDVCLLEYYMKTLGSPGKI
jgi:ADP-ribose pyrophosphatase YjhB (NUDIX family)